MIHLQIKINKIIIYYNKEIIHQKKIENKKQARNYWEPTIQEAKKGDKIGSKRNRKTDLSIPVWKCPIHNPFVRLKMPKSTNKIINRAIVREPVK